MAKSTGTHPDATTPTKSFAVSAETSEAAYCVPANHQTRTNPARTGA
jgi:hypothetical protein